MHDEGVIGGRRGAASAPLPDRARIRAMPTRGSLLA
jgi:hypothetical protein